jgi:hypothetical protein
MNTRYLDQLAQQLKAHKSPACRRAIERILATMKKRCEDGEYDSRTKAELDFRTLVANELACQKQKPAKTATHDPHTETKVTENIPDFSWKSKIH